MTRDIVSSIETPPAFSTSRYYIFYFLKTQYIQMPKFFVILWRINGRFAP